MSKLPTSSSCPTASASPAKGQTHDRETSLMTRRNVLQAAVATATVISPALRAVAYAQGSDAPEKKEVKIGFIPLTDCASVVMASVMGFDKKHGVTIIPSKEASWAGVRDKLVNGELDFAHALYGLVYGVHMGTARPEERHGRADEPEQQRPGHHAVQKTGRQRRRGRRRPGQVDGRRKARIHLRADLPHRHPRHVAVLLDGGQRHQPDEGRQSHHRAAAADGGQHARGQHGRFLRGRALEPPRHHRRHRRHGHHHPGHLERPP